MSFLHHDSSCRGRWDDAFKEIRITKRERERERQRGRRWQSFPGEKMEGTKFSFLLRRLYAKRRLRWLSGHPFSFTTHGKKGIPSKMFSPLSLRISPICLLQSWDPNEPIHWRTDLTREKKGAGRNFDFSQIFLPKWSLCNVEGKLGPPQIVLRWNEGNAVATLALYRQVHKLWLFSSIYGNILQNLKFKQLLTTVKLSFESMWEWYSGTCDSLSALLSWWDEM